MKNIVSTIPKNRGSWELVERSLRRCDGEGRFFLINCGTLPKHTAVGQVCFVVFDGKVRGYLSIVDIAPAENYRKIHGLGKHRPGLAMIMATWQPYDGPDMTGFQGWRYTELRP